MGFENRDVVFFYALPKCTRTRKREFHHRKQCHSCMEGCLRDVLSGFHDPLLSLVENYFLSIGNNDHLFCFHFVYKRLINRMLENFPCSWLNHKIRTARNETPMQLFLIGMQQVAHKNDVVSSQFFESLNVVSVQITDLPEFCWQLKNLSCHSINRYSSLGYLIMFIISQRKLAYEYDQMHFTILEEIKSALPKSLFYNQYSQIK